MIIIDMIIIKPLKIFLFVLFFARFFFYNERFHIHERANTPFSEAAKKCIFYDDFPRQKISF